MILETKQVLFRAHVHSLDHRSGNAYDYLEQSLQGMDIFGAPERSTKPNSGPDAGT